MHGLTSLTGLGLYVLRRVAVAVPILLGVSLLVFILLKMVPGGPVDGLLGPLSTPEQREQLESRLGFDRPAPVQYAKWLVAVGQGDFGDSITKQTSAARLVWDAFRNTLVLAAVGGAAALAGGVVLGTVWAHSRRAASRASAAAASVLAVSIPQYSFGVVLIAVLAVRFGVLPSGGMSSATGEGGLVDSLRHLALPAATAAVVPMGIIARTQRSALLDIAVAGLMESLRARGFGQGRVLSHALHNTLPSLLTVAGLQFGYLLSGVVFVEIIFSWPGLGLRVFEAISQRDLPVIQAGVMISALAFVVMNLVVDVLHAVIDPRVAR